MSVKFTGQIVELAQQYPLPGAVLALITIVGVLKLANIVGSLLAVLLNTLVSSGRRLSEYGAKKDGKGTWAVITGATAGIGEQFAQQLAKAGFNVLIVSRTAAKLAKVADEIRAATNVQVEFFVLDAAKAHPGDYAKLAQTVEQLPVAVLINNVGQSHEMPVPFAETTDKEMREIIQINNIATLETTKAVLPSIQRTVEAKKARRGLIMTMGSFAGLTPTPLLATYSGSKAFLQGWSSALGAELAASRIDVELVLSYLVTSNMSKIRRTSALIPDPRAFVKAALGTIGRPGGAQERAYTSTPYWSHALMHWGIHNSVGVFSGLVSKINLNMHVGIRKRALRKAARAASTSTASTSAASTSTSSK